MSKAPPTSSALISPNRSNCPAASARLTESTESMASACTISRPLRGCSRESNAPALISDSMTFLLQTAGLDLGQEVGEVGELDPSACGSRSATRPRPVPTLRTADSPNRMSVPTVAKFFSEALTSGGSTLMPMVRHSAR